MIPAACQRLTRGQQLQIQGAKLLKAFWLSLGALSVTTLIVITGVLVLRNPCFFCILALARGAVCDHLTMIAGVLVLQNPCFPLALQAFWLSQGALSPDRDCWMLVPQNPCIS